MAPTETVLAMRNKRVVEYIVQELTDKLLPDWLHGSAMHSFQALFTLAHKAAKRSASISPCRVVMIR